MTDTNPLPFRAIADLVRELAQRQPQHVALIQDNKTLNYAELDVLMDRIAVALQRDGVHPTRAVAICALNSIQYAAVFLGVLRAGAVPVPLAPSSTPEQLRAMTADSGATHLFLDAGVAQHLGPAHPEDPRRVALDESAAGESFASWLAPSGVCPNLVTVEPDWSFNIIYSSGTTGVPKGIVHSHDMRWMQVQRAENWGFTPDCVTLLSTPLYSNTTLVAFLPTVAKGGTVVLQSKFDAENYLELAERLRVTHTMLVPVQYARLMAHPRFDQFDLSSFTYKFCTSAPFHAALKADVLARWPGRLIEIYGMTEGAGSCVLFAHDFPNKLHTVGRPGEGSDIRLIDEQGNEVAQGESGEIVGRSGAMMSGYHNKPSKTAEAQWVSPEGLRFIRTGDVGRFDADGFLILGDRKKDMIISGGFNVYPSDLEAVMRDHPAVADVSVVGVPSDAWGETPVAYVVLKPHAEVDAEAIRTWTNARLGKHQRVSDVCFIDALPRSAIGKVLKRDLRELYGESN
ncbi:class I adenylate-forming enzyme family protein [Noviherbaspirillum sp. Root189]|uniref:class I adenylate-forming enzyme family protein n=1 Tax=Noviherbaspirillum sp. Root189 TaxID=1736487 RepID=UPI00070FA9FE|nr:class I adenylate-forming enzyme family protein [Noviherbaspirillum sp. Root189]KRB82162.1 4-coumarate--CoA ligase [Noviherbaspirillum sp. Root189]